jgi:hypothetical protein
LSGEKVFFDKRENIVTLLDGIRSAAEEGRIKSIAVSCVTESNQVTGHYAFTSNANPFTLIGAMHINMNNIIYASTDSGEPIDD